MKQAFASSLSGLTMQAVTYLEEKIVEEGKVLLLELVVKEKKDLYLPEEVDREKVYSFFREEKGLRCSTRTSGQFA